VSRAWVGLPVVVTLVAYRRVLHGYFYWDDFLHLYEFVNQPVARVLTRPFAGHLYILRNLAFMGLYRGFGTWSPPYFAIVLALHLANVALVFATIRALTDSVRLASVAAASWGAAPIHATTLAWISVFGELMALLFFLIALYEMVRCTTTHRMLSARRASLWTALLVAGATCFGTGLATAAVSPLLVLLLVPRAQRTPAAMRWVYATPLIVLILYLACWWLSGDELGGNLGMAVTSLGAWNSAGLVLQMLAGLTTLGLGQLFPGPLVPHDVVRGVTPVRLMACGAATLLGAAWWRGKGLERAAGAAALLAALAQYGMVGFGRAAVYQLMRPGGIGTFFGEARYHYGPMALLTVACALAIHTLTRDLAARKRFAGTFTVCWFGIVLTNALWRPTPIDERPQVRLEVTNFQKDIDDRIDRAPAEEPVYVPNRLFESAGLFLAASPEIYPGWAATFTIFFPSNVIRGHRVFFVDTNAKAVAAAHRFGGSRIAAILTDPAQHSGD
jgi:hypothetical protein